MSLKLKLRTISSPNYQLLITKSTLMDLFLFIAQNSYTRNPQTKLSAGNSPSLQYKMPREACLLLSFLGIPFLLEQSSRKVINTLVLFYYCYHQTNNHSFHFSNRLAHYYWDSNYCWTFDLHCWWRLKYLQANCRCQNRNLAVWSVPQCQRRWLNHHSLSENLRKPLSHCCPWRFRWAFKSHFEDRRIYICLQVHVQPRIILARK